MLNLLNLTKYALYLLNFDFEKYFKILKNLLKLKIF